MLRFSSSFLVSSILVASASLLVALTSACGDDESAGGGGAGGSGSASTGSSSTGSTSTGDAVCDLPSSEMPSGSLVDAGGAAVQSVSGAVVASEEGVLVVDTCFAPDADCEPTRHTLTMDGGLAPTVPLGTLVEVTISPAQASRDADDTPTVRVTNLPELQGVTNPTMTQSADWFLSTTAHTCAHPGLTVTTRDRCDGPGGRVYALVLERGAEDDELSEGDLVTNGFNGILFDVSYLGGWTVGPGEIGSCRWQVRRRPVSP